MTEINSRYYGLSLLRTLRQHLHERGFKSSRFHALDFASKTIVSKRLQGANLTVFKCLRYTVCRSHSQAFIIEEGDLSSSEILRQNSNRVQIDAVSLFTRQMKLYHFENASLLSAFSNLPVFGNSLDQRRVKGSCNRIESDAVTNETAFV